MYNGLNPLELLNYPAEDVFNLIYDQIDYINRQPKTTDTNRTKPNTIRRPAGDTWF